MSSEYSFLSSNFSYNNVLWYSNQIYHWTIVKISPWTDDDDDVILCKMKRRRKA